MAASALTASAFKAAMSSFAAGVTIVTTQCARGAPEAMTATAFSAVSLSPPLCLVCIDQRARAHRSLITHGCFAINILSADQQALSAQFAAPVADRFAGVSWQPGEVTRCPILDGALAHMECRVAKVHSGGDHDIVIGHVAAVQVREGAPLVYWRGRYASLGVREPNVGRCLSAAGVPRDEVVATHRTGAERESERSW